jgi:hypothetical protein
MKTIVRALGLMALLALTAVPAWAGQQVGSSPYTADLLVSGLNTGRLNPGQEYWYAYSRLDLGDSGYNSIVLSLNFEAEGRAVASRVNFQVFNFEQVDSWLKDSSGPLDSMGLGAPASADFDAVTGERLWAGPVGSTEVYYIRIFNLSPSPVRFRLTAVGQKSAQMDAYMAVDKLVMPGSEAAPVIPAAVGGPVEIATGPELAEPVPMQPVNLPALPLQPDDTSPTSTSWLLAAQAINGLSPEVAATWLMSAARLGWLPLGEQNAAVPVNPYSGQPAAVGGGEGNSGGAAEATAAVPVNPNQGSSIYPNQPLELLAGANTGRLEPKAEHWYTFTPGQVDGKKIENMSLTMFFTPGEPNIARQVIFELFTGSQYPIWERGTPDDMEHFGAGAWVSRDWDYQTGERLWHGTVVDGDQYYVKITNGANQWIDYHLLTGDIINTELGPKVVTARPVAPATPTGEDIGSPLPIGKGHQTGRLAAGEDIWFSFEYKNFDPDKFDFRNYLIELNHTPGAGYVTNYVNFEIYPFQEQQIWRRGNTDQITPLGAGSDLKYDVKSGAHTWVWNGHLVSNTTYFIRVRNDSVADIDYDLFIQQRR